MTRTRRGFRVLLAGVIIAGVSLVGAPFDGPESADGSLPHEFFGFVLGEKVDAMNASRGGVMVKSRPMDVVKGNDFPGSPKGAHVTTYKDCPLRFANKCVWEADVAGQRPDDPGSLTLFVAGVGEPKLLGLGFKLNPRVWRDIPLEKADETFRRTYGSPVKASPPRQETFTVKATGAQFVSASASWQWQDGVVRLFVSGDGRHLPGSFGNPDPLFTYVLYAERIDVRRLVDERARTRLPKTTGQ